MGGTIFWSDYALKVVDITLPLFFFCPSGKDNMKTPHWFPASAEILKALVGCSTFMRFLEISSPDYNFPSRSSTPQTAAERVDSGPSVRGVCRGVTRRRVRERPHCPRSHPWLWRFEECGIWLCRFTNFTTAVYCVWGLDSVHNTLLRPPTFRKVSRDRE